MKNLSKTNQKLFATEIHQSFPSIPIHISHDIRVSILNHKL